MASYISLPGEFACTIYYGVSLCGKPLKISRTNFEMDRGRKEYPDDLSYGDVAAYVPPSLCNRNLSSRIHRGYL
jgi:hypothetical protein